MSFSALALPSQTYIIQSTSSVALNTTNIQITGSNQIYDWVTINSPFVYPGEVYYIGSDGNYYLASTATSASMKSVAVIEQTAYAGSGSVLAKAVYFGKVNLSGSGVTLIDGNSYYLATSSNNSVNNTGSYNVRNTTTFSTGSYSKLIYVATSTNTAVVLNYRGYNS